MAMNMQKQPSEWQKGNLIGSGSFGNVHLAIDNATGALFVIKSATSPAGISSLKNEASILENLDSPYIVSCVGKDVKESFSLFYEYMAGGSLANIAQNFGGCLNENLIRFYTKGILQGLKYLHRNNIVHCDIKCQNVLVSNSGAVKLADFGCATRVNGKKPSGAYGGTPLWMAPEVLRNEALDFSADMWSLGCTIIEMATGKQPWGGEVTNAMAMMLNIAKGNNVPEFPSNMSPEGLDFLGKCLERDPRKRWTAQRLLSHPFVTVTGKAPHVPAASSPTSILNSFASDSDSDSDSDDEFVKRIEVFTKKSSLAMEKKFGRSTGFDSEEDWITVRS